MSGKKNCVILLWSASGSHDDFSALEARRNVKMVSFERRDPNLKDIIEFVAVAADWSSSKSRKMTKTKFVKNV